MRKREKRLGFEVSQETYDAIKKSAERNMRSVSAETEVLIRIGLGAVGIFERFDLRQGDDDGSDSNS